VIAPTSSSVIEIVKEVKAACRAQMLCCLATGRLMVSIVVEGLRLFVISICRFDPDCQFSRAVKLQKFNVQPYDTHQLQPRLFP
jgi:hypothetical protein